MDNEKYTLDVLKDYNKEGYYPKYIGDRYTILPNGVISAKELINKGIRAAERKKVWDKCVLYTGKLKYITIADLCELHERFIMFRQQRRNMRNKAIENEENRLEKLTKQEQIDIIKSFFDEAQDRSRS